MGTSYQLRIKGSAGKRLEFAVERCSDGRYYYPGRRVWCRPTGKAAGAYAPPVEYSPGHYLITLPDIDHEHDYCIHVVDTATSALVISQLIDGTCRPIHAPRGGAGRDRPAPRNQYHGGFVLDTRPGRQVELE